MFYRLKTNFILRGWEKMSWVLVERPENLVTQISKEEFQTLLLCDGETELSEEILNDSMKEVLEQYKNNGIVTASTEPCPLSEDQYYRYFNNRNVSAILWSITGRCNYKCRHCFMNAPDAMLGELSTNEAINMIDQMAECGVLRVDITGGEPFVRRDFWQLVDRIICHKINIGMVYTNGWLLNDKVLDEFERRNLHPEFSISFDGIGWHDWMRGVPGAEEAAIRALQLCNKRGFSTNVEMCIHRGNQKILTQTFNLLNSLGVSRVKAGNVDMTELWHKHCEGNSWTEKEYIDAMIKYIPEYYKSGCPISNLILTNVITLHSNGTYDIIGETYDGTEKCLNCYMCDSARWSCYITPEGRLLPCMPMTSTDDQNKFPRIQDIGLRCGLSNSFYMRFVDGRVKDLLEANAECNACAYRYKCGGGCRASALLYGSHDLMGCDRIMCTLWKEGYVERIRKTADDAIAKYGVPSKKGGSSEVDT